MYIILNHYSNENTHEFGIITVQEKAFALLSDAIAFADKLFLSDKDAYGQEDCVAATAADCPFCVQMEIPYSVGEREPGNFECYHNVYAVVQVEER